MSLIAPRCPDDPLSLTDAQKVRFLANRLEAHEFACCAELHSAFFFDGTDNNAERDRTPKKHSNVARLFDVFEIDRSTSSGRVVSFRNYAAGVGTPFKDQVGDLGLGRQRSAGLSSGWGGEARINWALLQLLNNLHFHFYNATLAQVVGIPDLATVQRMSGDINVPFFQLKDSGQSEVESIRNLWTATKVVTPVAVSGEAPWDVARLEVLKERRKVLAAHLAPFLKRKPTVKCLHVSVFGFSRGAAEARVFCSWLKDALDEDFTLAGISVKLDFLGIFDTVASVGIPQSLKEGIFTGHNAWATDVNLRVPTYVGRCVHLVAAQEVRGSFPLDTAGNAVEYVYPGAHSDVGGGYPPEDQGKSPADADKLSQIPLCHMYREAIVAGVPFNVNGSLVAPAARDALKVSPKAIAAFNDYLDATAALPGGATTNLMHAHYGQYLRWRRLRLPDAGAQALEAQDWFKRAGGQDQENLRAANLALATEYKALEFDERYNPAFASSQVIRWLRVLNPAIGGYAAFEEFIYGKKMEQWSQTKPYWNDRTPLDKRVVALFDGWVHDSRAGFRPFADEEEAWTEEQKERMTRLKQQQDQYKDYTTFRDQHPILNSMAYSEGGAPVDVSPEEAAELERYRKTGVLPMQKASPEFSSVWGYLRWRGIYSPSMTLSERASKALHDFGEAVGDELKAAKDSVGNAIDRAIPTSPYLPGSIAPPF